MKKNQKTIIICILLFSVLGAIKIIENSTTYGSGKLVEAFQPTNFGIEEVQLSMWGEYIPKYMTKEEMGEIVRKITKGMGIEAYEEQVEESEFKKVYTIEKRSIHANTKIQFVETITFLEDGVYKPENHVIINLSLFDRFGSIDYFEKELTNIFEELMMKPTKNIGITAAKEGLVSELYAREMMEEMIKALHGETKEMILDENLNTAYGYSKHVKDYVVSKGERVNMDLAITYNELDKKTYLYAGIPVITFEY